MNEFYSYKTGAVFATWVEKFHWAVAYKYFYQGSSNYARAKDVAKFTALEF